MAEPLHNLKELLEAHETVRAIRGGEVDAFVVETEGLYRVHTLAGADTPYRMLVEAMREGAVTVHGDGGVLYCNGCFAEATGRSVAEIVGSNISDWLVMEKPIDVVLPPSLGNEGTFDATLRGAKRLIPVSVSACVLSAEPEVSVYCLILSDVSTVEHLRAEHRALAQERAELGAIFDGLPFAVAVADVQALTYLNPAAQALMTRVPQLAQRVLADAVPVLSAGGGPLRREISLSTGAEERTFEVHATKLNAVGPAPRVLIVIEDVTSAREAMRNQQREEQLRETFVGILGHDLRNPLMAVVGAAQMLKLARSGEQRDRAAAIIERSVDRMRRLIDDMLDLTLARIGGGIPIAAESADLGDIVQSAIDEIGRGEPSVDFRIESYGDLAGRWDGERLAQVVANLLANAVKHGEPSRPIDIRIDGRRDALVELSVTNHGTPIDPQRLPTIFDPFERGDTRPGTRGGGIGLGLYIAEQIVRAHGGTIWVTSTASEGTTFTFELPRSC